MKTISYKVFFLSFVLLLITFLNSCDKSNLDVNPDRLTESSYFTTDDEFFKAIIGNYAKLVYIYDFNNNDPNHGMWLYPGDDLTSGLSAGGDRNIDIEAFSGINPGLKTFQEIYGWLYELINRSNVVIEKINAADPKIFTNEASKNSYMGEALFLRSLGYYKLWNYYGPAPLLNKRVASYAESSIPSSKGTQILDQAIEDLNKAVLFLPASRDAKNVGRIIQDAAYGLLGKILIVRACWNKKSDAGKSTADYNAAITAFNSIKTRTLTTDFGANLDAHAENNSESLFEFQAGSQPGFENIWLGNDFGWDMSSHAYWGFYNCEWSWWSGRPIVPTKKLVAAFEPGDPRSAETFAVSDDPKYGGYSFQKYIKQNASGSMTSSLNNPRILRLADVILLKAEAVLQSGGNKPDAIALVNQIRQRARGAGAVPADLNSAETNTATIMQWIMDERFRELSGEDDHRWVDLKRWHYAGYIDLSTWDGGITGFSSNRLPEEFKFNEWFNATQGKMWFPLPQTEIERNKVAVQNPGY